ncbi:MAG: BACON domain-containing carbohydrate-binding protein [Vicinamibacterales bacterium]
MGDTSDSADVFVRDLQTATTTRVSVGLGGAQASGSGPTISADGRWVAFVSGAANLVAGDTNGWPDVFVHDRQTGTTTRASVGPGGAQADRGGSLATISADGRWVVFESSATNLVAGDTNGQGDVFVHDRQTGTTTRASVGVGGEQSNGDSRFSVISGDGRWVAFFSNSSNLVPNDWDDYNAFVHDRQTGTTTRLGFGFPVISADGRWVGVGAGVYDQQTGTWASAGFVPGTWPVGESNVSAISADGRWVAFTSSIRDLVTGDTNGVNDVFVYDQQAGTRTRVSLGAGGVQANGATYSGSISDDGRFVAFESGASNLVAGDTNGRWDVFVRDRIDPACTVALAPASAAAPAGGATDSLQVTMPATCAWTATSNDPAWLTVTGGASGTGSGTVNYSAAANDGPPRTGSISIWDQQFTVSQGAAAPVAPTGLVASSVAGSLVTLRWTIPPAGPVPTGFVLEGGVQPGQVLASIPTGSAASTFTFAAPPGSFYVRVHALTAWARSGASNEIRIHVNTPVAPSAPANLLGLVNGSTLALAWTNTYAGGAPTSVALDVSGTIVASLPLGLADHFSFAGVPGGTYTLSVRAQNAAGISPASNPITLSFPGPCSGAPGLPADTIAYRVGRTVFVAWAPASFGPAPTGYLLQVTGSFVGGFATTGRGLSGTVGPGSYTFRVVAANPCGASAATPPQTVVVP